MISGVFQKVWDIAEQWFPNRQIYHRSEGQVRYFELTTTLQVGSLGGAIALTGWLCFTTISVALHGYQMSQQTAEMERVRRESSRMVNEAMANEAATQALFESQVENFESTAEEFRTRHDTLRQLIALVEDIDGDDYDPSPALENGRLLMAAAPADPTPRRARDDVMLSLGDPNAPTDRVSSLIEQQDVVLAEAEDAAEARLENLRAVLRLTGLRPDDVLAENRENEESGGPFLSIASSAFGAELDMDDAFSARVARIATRMIEAREIEAAVQALPLHVPIGVEHRETSDYGARIDPFTGRPAYHSGQDFVAFRNAPIQAAGPGRVVYAGWRAGYGRTVEIDHGYGFMTRYGHLNSIDVRRGDTVYAGERIGGMGSTGRSTSTHLHYEVWNNRQTLDPERFMRAGQYVQQN
ncbi:M23 family metallopeptidase [Hyphobacterium sp.]|uniref:M23 family metallopeptidase n=1 Tax=Hyphobacterium sp. TaxID=2004662 RepID=UPI003B5285B2